MSAIRKLSATGMVVAYFCSLVFAQGGATGAITGTVQDASGAVVSGAKVNLLSEATGEVVRSLTSDSSGLFTASLLPVGSYSVEVSAAGFSTTKFSGIVVRITETTRMTAAMKVTGAKEIIEVQSQVADVSTTTATTGESLGSTTITSLPLATRNFQQLLTLSAGASSDLNNASQLGRGQVFIHVNGGREDNNNYLIDGVTVADYSFGELTYTPLPSPDAIQEFKVSTSLYDATQGRNGGGNINATLKNGTAQFHGDAWEYFRNTALDAQDFFLKKVVIKQNIFGGDLGGPIGPKAQLGYFYGSYQGTRQRSGASPGTFINTTLPYVTVQDRQSAALMATDCGVGAVDPVAFNILSFKSNQFGPGAGGYLFPLPTSVSSATPCGTDVPFLVTDPGKFTDNQFSLSWDRDFRGGNDRVAARFFYSNSDTFEPFGADGFNIQTGGSPLTNNINFPLDIPLHGRFATLTHTHIFSNALLNEFRFGVNIIGDKLDNKPPVTGVQASPASTATVASGFGCGNSLTSGSQAARLAHWVNPAAYVPDPVIPLANGAPGDATGYGNAPRNCLIGPDQKNVDFTLGKTFSLTEHQSLRFRADFFNLFNHPSFANPSATDVESLNSFAKITSVVGTPRLLQLSLKYLF
jgi:hypothetical protein